MKTSSVLKLLGAMVVVSGVTAATTFKVMENNMVKTIAQQDSSITLTPAGFFTTSSASVTDNDFTRAAEKTVNAVVGITNKQVRQAQSFGGMNDPFFDFFFGQRGQRQQEPQSTDPTPVGAGSGVIISSDGYIVTNNHVIDKADELTVTLNDSRRFTATVVGTDPTTDIALLKVDAKDLPTIPMGQSDALKVGEWVLAVGNPFNLTSTVTAGIVSAKARSIGEGSNKMGIESFIQTDAAVNPGNSGGALVNTAGELVGINTAIYSQTGNYAGYSFAVPSSIVSKVVTDLKQYGTVQRALLGIIGGDVNADVVDLKDLKVSEGVYVDQVSEEGGAAEAGIKPGDVITSVNNTKINTMAQLQGQIARYRPGDKVKVVVDRKGETKNFTVTLKNTKGNTEVIQTKGIDKLGATFKNLSSEELVKYGVRTGVQIAKLETNGLFYRAGLREKMVIIKINDQVVKSDKEIEAIFNQLTTKRAADQDPVMFIAAVTAQGRVGYFAVDLSK
jgi:Do/DeqQ family serine protease